MINWRMINIILLIVVLFNLGIGIVVAYQGELLHGHVLQPPPLTAP